MPVVACVVAGGVVFGACSDEEGAGLGPGAASTTSTPAAEDNDGITYVVHAVTTDFLLDGDVLRISLGGVERRTPWLGEDESGVLPTGALIDQWAELGLVADPPQAAFVPAANDQTGAVLELSEPEWDEASRVLTYTAVEPDEVDPALTGFVADADGNPPTSVPNGEIGASTVMIHQPAGEPPTLPAPTTTTTTSTTTPSSTTTETSTTTSSSLPSTQPPPPTTTTTIFVAAPPPPTAPPPPPQGDPRIVASTTSLRLPSAGGSTTFTLRNLGSGVGSWSINGSQGVGISVAPSAGVIFPGALTTVRVTYDGTYVNDFRAELVVVTAAGPISIEVTVGGN